MSTSTQTSTVTVAYRDITTLKLWRRNYRRGDVGAILHSIVAFGFNGVLRVWRGDVVVAGNHMLQALLQLKASGQPAPRGIAVVSGRWLAPCLDVSHLSESEAEAYAIADNRTQERAESDLEQLASLLATLAAENEALLTATGYDGDELDALLRMAGSQAVGADDPYAAWRGMPAFEQEDQPVFHTVKVHFETPEDLAAFAALVQQNISEHTRYIYYPEQKRADRSGFKVVDEPT